MSKLQAHTPKVALVVDDDLDLLEVFKTVLLEEDDFRVLTAAVPDLVVPLVEAAPPEVLVLDIALPGQSGWEVLAALRKSPRFRMLPVLVVSAMPDTKEQVAHLNDPWVEFLAKPIDLDTLLKQVHALMARHQQAPDSPSQ